MFKTKRKIDSKIRFQNPRFRSQLKQARGYKRPARPKPQSSWELFLSAIGLGSWVSRAGVLVVFLGLIYLVFVPNFLFVNHVQVSQAEQITQNSVLDLTNSYLNKSNPWPQKNLLLLSKQGLKSFLLDNDQKVFSVDKISKKFPSTLIIDYTPRVDEFILENASSTYYSISQDGLATGEIIPNASGTLPSNLILIKLNNNSELTVSQQALATSSIGFLNQLKSRLPMVAGSGINYYQLDSLQDPDLTVYLQNGLKIMFDLTSNINQALNQLTLLFSQFSPGDIKKLFYVDMRFAGKSYVCNKASPCVNDINLPSTQATSTSEFSN